MKRLLLAIGLLVLGPLQARADEAKDCVLTPEAPLNFVLRHAAVNVLTVFAADPACAGYFAKQSRLQLSRGDGSARLAADIKSTAAGRFELTVHDVDDVAAGTSTWKVAGLIPPVAELGSLTVEVVELVPERLVVGVTGAPDQGVQVVRTPGEGKSLPAAARDYTRLREAWLLNVVEADLPARLRNLDGKRYRWEIQTSTWGKSARFYCGVDLDQRAYRPDGAPAWLDSHEGERDYRSDRCTIQPERIRFEVRQPLATPLVVTLALLERGEDKERERELARFPVTLATSAQVESLPIPVWSVAEVRCANKRIAGDLTSFAHHGGVIAIEDEALSRKTCTLRLTYPAKNQKNWPFSKELAGPQGMEVTVQRGKASKKVVLVVDPHLGAEIPLPAPADAEKETGLYEVKVRLASVRGVHYLEGSLGDASEDGNAGAEFNASLRPRGPHGLPYPFRFYLTFPLTATTIRFPARPRAITSSTSMTAVEIEGPRAGAMMAFELWNYDADRNLLPFPLQVQAGFSILKLEDSPLSPSALVGMSLAFPVFDKDTIATSITVGAFWEYDFPEKQHGFVLNFSVDLFKALKVN